MVRLPNLGSDFLLLSRFLLLSPVRLLYTVKNMFEYKNMTAYYSCYQTILRVKYFYKKTGVVRSVDWIFITGAPA